MQFVNEQQAVLTLAFLALIAGLVLMSLMRRQGRDPAQAEALHAAVAERDALRDRLEDERVACGRLAIERDGLARQLAGLREELAGERERLSGRERDLSALKVAETRLSGDCDRLKADCTKLVDAYETLEGKLRAEAEAVRSRDAEIGRLNGEVQVLTARLAAEADKHAKLVEETERNRAAFVAQFKAISGEILQTQGRAATEAQKSELEKIINPFKAEMEGLKSNLKEMSERAEKERQSLGNQLLVMQTEAHKLADQANGLARALRGDAKMQGNWGEMILERLLEAAGLEEGTAFTRQGVVQSENGSRLIPDVVLHLPGERDIVIDSKVTLVAYQDLVQAEDKAREASALRRHVLAVRNHIRSLSEKEYAGLSALDSIMMFLPNDDALRVALSSDPNLQLEAAEKRVHLVTPSTLVPTLNLVRHLWTIDSRNRNVDDIVDRAGRLHDKFVSVVESFQGVGESLRRASDCHEKAMNQLIDGRGNVIRQVDQLRLLGARARKALPAELLAAGDEDEPASDDAAAAPAPAGSPALTAS